jgi:hypothetical protein
MTFHHTKKDYIFPELRKEVKNMKAIAFETKIKGNHPILWHIMKIYANYGFEDFLLL